MRTTVLLAAVAALALSACAHGPYDDLRTHQLSIDGDVIRYYVLPGDLKQAASKLVVFLDGSALSSALGERGPLGWKTVGAAAMLREQLSPAYDVLVPEYRNVELGAKVDHQDSRVMEKYTLEGRVEAAAAAIDHGLAHQAYASVAIVGFSEGSTILAAVYRRLTDRSLITRLCSLSYGAMAQYDGFRIFAQRLSEQEIPYLAELKKLDERIAEINAYPLALDRFWLGWPFRRWSTFGPYDPLPDFEAIEAPLLVVHGTADVNAPVESSRRLVDALQRLGRVSVTYRELPEENHSFHGDFKPIFDDLQRWLESPQS